MSQSDQSTLLDHGVEPEGKRQPDCRIDLNHLRYRRDRDGETAGYRCDSWDCRCCGHRMKMNLLEGIDRLLDERPSMSRLLTLTVDTKAWDREAAHEQIGKAWNALRSNITAAYGDFSYVWVREETDKGYPHLHVLVSRYLPQGKVAEWWRSTGMGSVVDLRKVDVRKAGHYLAKYLAKDAMAFMPSGVHRYGSSADIDLGVRGSSDDDGGGSWSLMAYDHVVEDMVTAVSGDFRRDPDRPPPT